MEIKMEKFKLRCRRCRCVVLTHDEVVNTHGQSMQEKSCSNSSTNSVWYVSLESDVFPWIQEAVNKASWTKGKLSCPKCHGRIGSFDFVGSSQCPCGQQTLPGVHILCDRVDQVKPSGANEIFGNDRAVATHLTNPQILSLSTSNDKFDKSKILNEQTRTTTDVFHTSSDCAILECSDSLSFSDIPQPQSKIKQNEQYVQSRLQAVPQAGSPGMWYTEKNPSCAITQRCSTELDSMQNNPCATIPGCSSNFDSMQNIPCKTDSPKFDAVQHDPCATTRGCSPKLNSVQNNPCESGAEHPGSFSPLHSQFSGTRDPVCSGHHLKARVKRKDLRRRQRQKKGLDVLDLELISHEIKENRFQMLPEEEISSDDDVLEDILDKHVCPVCLDVYLHPHTCHPCGHMFCESCLRQLAHKSDNSTSFPCPMCRDLIRGCVLEKELTYELKICYPELYKYRLVTDRKYLSHRFPLPQSTDCKKPRTLNARIIYAFSHQNFMQFSRSSVKGITFLGAVIFLLLVLCVTLAL